MKGVKAKYFGVAGVRIEIIVFGAYDFSKAYYKSRYLNLLSPVTYTGKHLCVETTLALLYFFLFFQ